MTAVRPHRVAAGRVVKALIERGWRPPPLHDRGFDRLLADLEAVEAPELPPKQHEILELFAEGLTREEIASRMGIGAETVKKQSSIVRRKLGARTTPNAVAIALRIGVIE